MDLMFMECRSVISILPSLGILSNPIVNVKYNVSYFDKTSNSINWYSAIKPTLIILHSDNLKPYFVLRQSQTAVKPKSKPASQL